MEEKGSWKKGIIGFPSTSVSGLNQMIQTLMESIFGDAMSFTQWILVNSLVVAHADYDSP